MKNILFALLGISVLFTGCAELKEERKEEKKEEKKEDQAKKQNGQATQNAAKPASGQTK